MSDQIKYFRLHKIKIKSASGSLAETKLGTSVTKATQNGSRDIIEPVHVTVTM